MDQERRSVSQGPSPRSSLAGMAIYAGSQRLQSGAHEVARDSACIRHSRSVPGRFKTVVWGHLPSSCRARHRLETLKTTLKSELRCSSVPDTYFFSTVFSLSRILRLEREASLR